VKHSGGNIMLWGCIAAKGVGWIVRLEGNMDAAQEKTFIFQQDNNPKHTSKLATS
ncbi:hypothetical protein PAXRUDRAFT_173731, partial [Paxillus rubicundulus Ve08.2h10]